MATKKSFKNDNPALSFISVPSNEDEIAGASMQTADPIPSKTKTLIKNGSSIMGFRASKGDIARWRSYAAATGMRINDFCTAALDEYIRKNGMDEEQSSLYEKLLEAEKIKIGLDA